jgi:prevent-host-death family protein
MEVAIRELKNHLSKYIHRVQSGEELIVTSRGKPVARLMPPLEEKQVPMSEKEAIKHLDTLPWVRPGSGTKPKGAHRPIQAEPNECLSEHLLERE